MTSRNGPGRWLALLGFVAVAALGLGTVQTYPPPTCDEVSYGDTAASLLTRGIPAWTVFPEGDPFGRDVNVVHMGRLYLAGLSAVFRVLGVSLLAGRVYSLLGWALAAFLTYLIGTRFYNRRVGLAAAFAFLTSTKAFLTSHLVRPDVWTSASILFAIYLVWFAVERIQKSSLCLAAGLASAATMSFHANGFAFVCALSLAIALEIGVRQRAPGRVLIYFLGVTAGSLLVMAAQAWPNPQVAWQQLKALSLSYTGFGSAAQSSGLGGNMQSMGSFLQTIYWTAGKPLGLIEAGIGAAGLTLALVRRTSADRILAITLTVSMLAFGLIFSQRFVQYGVLWAPLLYILGMMAVEGMTSRLAAKMRPERRGAVFGLAAAGLVVSNVVGDAWLAYRYRGGNFGSMNAALGALIPPGARVLADPNWWWELRQDRVFISDECVMASSAGPTQGVGSHQPDPSSWVVNTVHELRPDYVLMDSAISCLDEGGPGWSDLQAYVASYCQVVGRVDGAWVGDAGKRTSVLGQTTHVYRCAR
jgi:hypothetical protein